MRLAELKLNWNSHNTYTSYEAAIQSQFNSGVITFASINTDISWYNV